MKHKGYPRVVSLKDLPDFPKPLPNKSQVSSATIPSLKSSLMKTLWVRTKKTWRKYALFYVGIGRVGKSNSGRSDEITLDERDKKIKEIMTCYWKSPSVSSYILVKIYINFFSSFVYIICNCLIFLMIDFFFFSFRLRMCLHASWN